MTDPYLTAVLHRAANSAFAWLTENAPTRYQFILRDGLYLDPMRDLEGAVIAPEAVIDAAHERRISIPSDAERLAVAHVAISQGKWIALDLPFVTAGPFATLAEAVAAVNRARGRILEALRSAGAEDLAATHTRWPPVPD